MYCGFDVRISFNDNETTRAWAQTAGQQKNEQDIYVRKEIKKFVDQSGVINATNLKEHWFPQLKADVFISHSHADRNTALQLSGGLRYYFGIQSFIDSSVWGYSEILLKKIDNIYCLNEGGETYSYELRNRSTAHVHMMLSTALSQMMDSTECVLFLNTPNSISMKNVIGSNSSISTASPWIYGELAMTHLLRRKAPQKMFKSLVEGATRDAMSFQYDVDLRNLSPFDGDDWNLWVKEANGKGARSALDSLYTQKRIDSLRQRG